MAYIFKEPSRRAPSAAARDQRGKHPSFPQPTGTANITALQSLAGNQAVAAIVSMDGPSSFLAPRAALSIQRVPIGVSYFNSKYAADARDMRTREEINGRNLATIKFHTKLPAGGWSQWTRKTKSSSGQHSEKHLYKFLKSLGVAYEVKWLYTELEPCGTDYYNCAARVAEWFPGAAVYYSLDYPSSAVVSTDNKNDPPRIKATKKIAKAKRRRRRATATLRRFNTRVRRRGSAPDPTVDATSFPRLTRVNSPDHKHSGQHI